MASRVQKVNYAYVVVPARAGNASKILNALKDEGVNLLALTGFPVGKGKAQVDLISNDMAGIRRVAKRNGWRLSKPKKGFLVQGDDQVGAASKVIDKLADNKINITAASGATAGKKRYGMMLWVKPKDYARSARLLNAK